MRTIAHLSDLHFGRHDDQVAEALLADASLKAADLAVVTGDLTQRGRIHQFEAARRFLDRLGKPALVVPGNHDIPLYDLIQRFVGRLARYQRFITGDLHPFIDDGEIAVLGLNTARSAAIANGRISKEQAHAMVTAFAGVPADRTRIVAAHHPLLAPKGTAASVVGRAMLAREALSGAGVHIVLGGHHHHAFSAESAPDLVEARREVLVIQAGTAISQRLRGETNSYNLLQITPNRVTCAIRLWDGAGFETREASVFVFVDGKWTRS